MQDSLGHLTLNLFTSIEDFELSQYKILAALKKYSVWFDDKKLYPALSELISWSHLLSNIVAENTILKKRFPRKLVGFDSQKEEPIYEEYEEKEYSQTEIEVIFNLINWFLPKITKTIGVGTEIFDLVDRNIAIEPVGLVPLYRKEGFLASQFIKSTASGFTAMKFLCLRRNQIIAIEF